jgi:hypothetical protein
MLDMRNLSTQGRSRKLSPKWAGPFHVKIKIGTSAYKLKMPNGWRGHPVFNEAYLKRYHGTPPEDEVKLQQEPGKEPVAAVERRYTLDGLQYRYRW